MVLGDESEVGLAEDHDGRVATGGEFRTGPLHRVHVLVGGAGQRGPRRQGPQGERCDGGDRRARLVGDADRDRSVRAGRQLDPQGAGPGPGQLDAAEGEGQP